MPTDGLTPLKPEKKTRKSKAKPKRKPKKRGSYFKLDDDYLASVERLNYMYDRTAGLKPGHNKPEIRESRLGQCFKYLKCNQTPVMTLCVDNPTLWMKYRNPSVKPKREDMGSDLIHETAVIIKTMQRLIKDPEIPEDEFESMGRMIRRISNAATVFNTEALIGATVSMMRESRFSSHINRPIPGPRPKLTSGPVYTYVQGTHGR